MRETSETPIHTILLALLAGLLLSLMVLFNGTLAVTGSVLFASWVPHVTGTAAALVALALLRPARATGRGRAPLWAYAGGIAGAVTVMLTAITLNSPLALSGTIALGLAGQMVVALLADWKGLFGMQRRDPGLRDGVALALVAAGSLVLILWGRGG